MVKTMYDYVRLYVDCAMIMCIRVLDLYVILGSFFHHCCHVTYCIPFYGINIFEML